MNFATLALIHFWIQPASVHGSKGDPGRPHPEEAKSKSSTTSWDPPFKTNCRPHSATDEDLTVRSD
jgi:hypothetical protein